MRALGKSVQDQGDAFKRTATNALAEAVRVGAYALREGMENATTTTGERRVERGGISAGRHKSGRLVGSIGENSSRLDWRDSMVWGEFGWNSAVFEKYFREQDLGTPGNYEAARAMQPAFIEARETLRAGLGRSFKRR